jgi:hypothetical protein
MKAARIEIPRGLNRFRCYDLFGRRLPYKKGVATVAALQTLNGYHFLDEHQATKCVLIDNFSIFYI